MNDLNDPIQNPENYKFGILYFNRKDSRYIVPKRTASTGWTINFARPRTYIVIFLVALIIIYFQK
ncbi:DUF5808 domain-containing protein [Pedobacter sp. L105]|uniref:DUF5808 domain-containing protein n=1 Tax=Pedobacter sp. L105 TaxID=1641871 RepID=UPI00131E8067|nr:DUF5808 domain-containing protein [Pedobacter sp. L105]